MKGLKLHPSGRKSVFMVKENGEKYIFVYDDPREIIRILGQCASDPELSFNWFDAALLGKLVKDDKVLPNW